MMHVGHLIFYYLNYIIFFIILFIVFKKKVIPMIKKIKKEDEVFEKNVINSYEKEYDAIIRKTVMLEVKISVYQRYENDVQKWKFQKEKISEEQIKYKESIAYLCSNNHQKIEESRLKKDAQRVSFVEIKNAFMNECHKRNLQTDDIFENALYCAKNNTHKTFSLKGKS